MKTKFLACLVGIALLVLSNPVFAQEEYADYGYGTVLRVNTSKNEITVAEYDYDTEEEIEISYSVNADTNIENISSLAKITPGTYVDIEYIEKGGRRIATTISVYPQEAGE